MKKYIKMIFSIICMFILVSCINVSAATLDCSVILKKGSKGENVKVLQTMLNEQEGCGLAVDGSFGPITRSCVISYQKRHNLLVDGIVGKKTCGVLTGVYKAVIEYEKSSSTSAIVVVSEANIRSSAAVSSKKIGSVKSGTVVEVIGEVGSWYKVNVDGIIGYIRNDLISLNCILLDISDQVLYVYEDGQLSWSTNVVTGNKGNHDTPVGNYKLNPNNFRTKTTLRGYNDDGSKYASYVEYWMPFILGRGIGFHDASWRRMETFVSTTYNGNGSHGCVNMQHEAAEKLFNSITTSTNVVVRN